MKLSYQWLRDWVALRLDAPALAERLTLAGLEVAALEPAGPALDKVVVAEITAVRPHPEAPERLRLCRVDAGRRHGRFEVVCGAPNAVPGLRVPFALPGAVLPGGRTIETTEIRGVMSAGMLCSAAELGLAESASGLLELGREARPGETLAAALHLDDTILEVELTPNRGDCLSVLGLAREVAALTAAKLRPWRARPVAARTKRAHPIVLAAPTDCPRYCGRVIEGIDPEAVTPLWMRERLRRSGVRAIHPVVDVTNYVMLELGQPMHAFDLARLAGEIRVRHAAAGETLELLDGRRVEVPAGALLIADAEKPLALAGIMGGAGSGVEACTRDIFLESAWFRPLAVARTARALGLQTESSYRFERGVDPALARQAIERATALLVEIAGGRPGPVLERTVRQKLPAAKPVRLRLARLERVLGTPLARRARVRAILSRLGMRPKAAKDGFTVMPPSYRFDLRIEEDLIEEVARIEGYEKIPAARPRIAVAPPGETETRLAVARLRALLADRDYHEVITYSFVDPKLESLLAPGQPACRLANPLSPEMAVMRTSLWPGLLQAVIYNLNRQQTRIRLFEIGRRFRPVGEGDAEERAALGGVVTGEVWPRQWGAPNRPADFFDVKGDVEALLALGGRGAEAVRFQPAAHPALHPGRSAEILSNGVRIGWLGELHPRVRDQLEIAQPVLLYELDLDALCSARLPVFEPISRFPAIRRDLSVDLPEAVPASSVLEKVRDLAGNLLVNLELFDEYRGEGIDYGRKSLTLALTFQDSSRTLKETEVEAVMAKVVSGLEAGIGARLRG